MFDSPTQEGTWKTLASLAVIRSNKKYQETIPGETREEYVERNLEPLERDVMALRKTLLRRLYYEIGEDSLFGREERG